jgi:hypothetical protein
MIALRSCLTALPLLAMTGAVAFAEAPTPEGAAHLTEALQTYLGKTPGVVNVQIVGDAYAVTLDAGPFIAKIPAEEVTASLTPLVMSLVDNGDGTWNVSQDQALDLTISSPGALDMKMAIGSMVSTGTFDAALMTFTTSSTTFSDLTMDQTVTTPDAPGSHVAYSIASGQFDTTGVAGANGGVDVATKGTMKGLTEVIGMPMMPDQPPMDVTLTADSYDLTSTATGLQPAGIYGLLAFFVAHPSEAEVTADQETLRAALTATLPVFDHVISTGTINAINVATPMGAASLSSMGVEIEANGVVADGMIREAFTLEGLTLPEGIVPPWATALVPNHLKLDFKAAGFDLAKPAEMLIAAFDLAKPEPIDEAMSESLLAALLPNGSVDITLAPGDITSAIYALGFEGAMSAGPMSIPTGKARITLKGYDEVMAALAAAPPEVSQQAGPALAMAQGIAKAEDGQLVWEIDASTPGQILVNGMDMGPMMGGQ